MTWIHAEQSLVIDARPEAVYAVVSDYRVGHPAILPREFAPLVVEQGGQGSGTIVRGSVTVWGRTAPFHQQVTEPEPGRVLVETDIDTGQYTTFTFEPLAGGRRTRVTIASEFPRGPAYWASSNG
jgi:Polyketide cyclase / dehydrase and lipid transport